jgi:hypothetical protein
MIYVIHYDDPNHIHHPNHINHLNHKNHSSDFYAASQLPPAASILIRAWPVKAAAFT